MFFHTSFSKQAFAKCMEHYFYVISASWTSQIHHEVSLISIVISHKAMNSYDIHLRSLNPPYIFESLLMLEVCPIHCIIGGFDNKIS